MATTRLGQIRVLIPLLTGALLLGLLAVNQWQTGEKERQQLLNERIEGTHRILDNLVNVMSAYSPAAGGEGINNLLGNIQVLSKVRVTDADGEVIFSNSAEAIGTRLANDSEEISLLNLLQGDSTRVDSTEDGQRLLGTTQYCNALGACGLIYVESDLSSTLEELQLQRAQEMLSQVFLVMLSTLIIAAVVNQRVSAISKDISGALQRFRVGDKAVRIEARGAAEFEDIATEANAMFASLEAEKQRSEDKRARYETLIEAMPGGLISVQCDGQVETVNRAAERLLGYPAKEIVGSNMSLFIHDDSVHEPEAWLQERDGTEQEVEVRDKKGRDFTIRLSLKSMKLDSQQLFIGVMIDVSPLKRLELELLNLNSKLRQSNQQLEQTSITDALTGLANRRHFDASLNKELQRTTRQASPLSLIVVDIDYFKQYNDHYGHNAGDEVLAEVGKCMRSIFKRSGDLPARYGGEEFAVILPACDGLELQERAETLRMAVEALELPHQFSEASEFVTVSLGAVTYKPETKAVVAPKPKELFGEADKALYRAKDSGRNRVVFAGQYLAIPGGQAPSPNLTGSILLR